MRLRTELLLICVRPVIKRVLCVDFLQVFVRRGHRMEDQLEGMVEETLEEIIGEQEEIEDMERRKKRDLKVVPETKGDISDDYCDEDSTRYKIRVKSEY